MRLIAQGENKNKGIAGKTGADGLIARWLAGWNDHMMQIARHQKEIIDLKIALWEEKVTSRRGL